jgi:hypothetical protein
MFIFFVEEKSMSQVKDKKSYMINLITNPTDNHISMLWRSRISVPEEIRYAFADASPSLDGFIKALKRREILCALAQNQSGTFISACWLHDLELDPDGIPRVGWLGGYVFPGHRGAEAVRASNLILDHFEALGVYHIHTAIHIDNRKSQFFIRSQSMMAFTYVCHYPEWTTFSGLFADALIFTRNPRDKMLAWMCTRKLASQRLLRQ